MGNKQPVFVNFKPPVFQSEISTPELITESLKPSKFYLEKYNQVGNHHVVAYSTPKHQQSKIQLKLLTYNVWFQQQNVENRIPCIIKLLEDSDADFICLQEVTKDFLHCLTSSKNLRNRYPIIEGHFYNWYQTVILSKYYCRTIKKIFDTTMMGRSMLLSELVINNNQNIIVGSMHFESLDSQKVRMSQLKEVFEACKQCPNVIIAGDFNFTDGDLENTLIQQYNYQDMWLQNLKKGLAEPQRSFTMPKTPKFPQWRPDHIITRIKTPKKDDNKIKIIGNFSIPPFEAENPLDIKHDGIVRTPSDHYGLNAKIMINFTS